MVTRDETGLDLAERVSLCEARGKSACFIHVKRTATHLKCDEFLAAWQDRLREEECW